MNAQPSSPLSVLLVEDRDDVASSTAELLELCGHTVRIAQCGADALEMALAEAPDVVLVDIGLPDMDGWEVARELRARSNSGQPVLIALTAKCGEQDQLASSDAGIDLHLNKPVDPRFLTDLLRRVREHKEAYLALHAHPLR